MKIVGHRGARGLAPENTLAALKKGLQHNVDELEFDLRVTKDNTVILHHDPTLTDASSKKMVIEDSTYKELLLHKPDLATFDQAIDLINRQVPMLVEVKPDVDTKPIIAIVDKFLAAKGRPTDILLASYSYKTLLELHIALPQVQKVVNERWSGTRATHRAKALNTKRLSMNYMWLWRGFIGPLHKRGWELYPYVLNDVKKAKRWQKYGIAGVITDYPDRFE